MIRHSRLIAVIGGTLALCCFAIPWVTFTKGSYKMSYETNVKTGRHGGASFRSSTPVTETGAIIPPIPESHHRYPGYKIALGFNLVTIAFVESILIFFCSIIILVKNSSGRLKRIVIISSIIGIICLIVSLLLATVIGENGLRSMGNTTYTLAGDLQIGGFGTAVGFIIVLVGAMFIPRENELSKFVGDLK